MVSLLRQSDFRSVQDLSFCYLCGEQFVAGDSQNRDHVPPECIFAPLDRDPLWLPAHTVCNKSYGLMDEKIGQLIALRYGKVPRNPGHRRLKFAVSPQRNLGAVVNLDIDAAVWRWIGGFHAALYRKPGVGIKGSLITLWLPRTQIRAYRWCSPPRIGCAIMSPNRSIGRVQGASLPSERCVRTSL
jgi:hypothetical protein